MKRKKIGVLTCHRIPNHGSFLQAWSLVEYLKALGQDVELIDYIYPNLYHLNEVQKNEIKRNTDTKTLLNKVKRYVIDHWYVCNSNRGLESILYKFLDKLFIHNPNRLYFKQLPLSKKSYRSPEQLKKGIMNYDILLSGSDQIWNPRFTGYDSSFFLQFGNPEARRIAYSSSFGTKDISTNYYEKYSTWLSSFSHIATREDSGCDIVRRLTGKECTHVLDPVMLFSKQQWRDILSNFGFAHSKPDKYIVSYCLDYVYKGIIDYADSLMNELADKLNLSCATLYKSNLNDVSVYDIYIHPFDFVNILLNANFALVSSFHGLAFCILFQIPFIVIIDSGENYDARLVDMLNSFGLTDRVLHLGENLRNELLEPIDWTSVQKIYDSMLKTSKSYITTFIEE